jgi:mono/diheme cytochrome c family protein
MKAFIVLAALVSLIVAAAVAAAPQPTPSQDSPEHIWQATCSYCHAGPMKAPELRGRHLPEAVLISFARRGAAGMPPFHPSEISDAELRALAHWISTQPAPAPPAARP